MIRQLHAPGFMREKVQMLTAMARDFWNSLPTLAREEFSDEGAEDLDERDVEEMVRSLSDMERNELLWLGENDRWMPRDGNVAILQSSMDEYYRVNAVVEPDPESILGERLREDPLQFSNVTPSPPPPLLSRLGSMFRLNKKDPRWVLVLNAKAIKRRRGRAPFVDTSATTLGLDNSARMVVFGDWGSGLRGAVDVARTTWNTYLLPEVGRRDLHAVHLGDVYYAGLKREYARNVSKHWPVPVGYEKDVRSWAIPGNHDMYSGGHGFFTWLAGDQRFANQTGSYFMLESDYWQVFGLDTSFDPRDFSGHTGELYGEQAAWVAQQRLGASGKKSLVLTHHQPFCAYSVISEELERRLRPVRKAKHINAWIWGHEHQCCLFDPHDRIDFPVLLGHGGFPEKPKAKIAGAPSLAFEWSATDSQGFLVFGFAVLDFYKDQISVALVDKDGNTQHKFTIV